jgi:hypothetical protein
VRLATNVSIEKPRLAEFRCRLELGSWTLASLDAELRAIQGAASDASEALFLSAELLMRTPFCFESRLPLPEPNELRVRLETLDCALFVYTALAMAGARDSRKFTERLAKIRYRLDENRKLDSNPTTGNIFDFSCEALLENAAKIGLVVDITEPVAGKFPPTRLRSFLKPVQRALLYDPHQLVAAPKFGPHEVSASFILTKNMGKIDQSSIKRGDIVLLTKSDPQGGIPLVDHLVVAVPEGGALNFLHSTRHFAWRPRATSRTPGWYTGIYYDEQGRREQIGVGYGGAYAGDGLITKMANDVYYGFLQDRRRTLMDYMNGGGFTGALFLRPLRENAGPPEQRSDSSPAPARCF